MISKIFIDWYESDIKYIEIFYLQSKGGILARACQYITELREIQENFAQSLDENAQLSEEAKTLRQVVNQLRKENSELKAQISKSTYKEKKS